ncbi:MAG: hypothetical protein KGJ86_12595, partial [Chloroflexota bacterium]|nr:hypothetical protein [Chloroflexota bacterium]
TWGRRFIRDGRQAHDAPQHDKRADSDHAPRLRAWLVLLISLFMFSAAQYDNWIWGWGIQWYLVPAAAAGSFLAITRWKKSWSGLAVAAALAAVAAYTFGAGVPVWIVGAIGIVALWRPAARYLAMWLALAGVSIGLYLYGLPASQQLGYAVGHPLVVLDYALVYIGSWGRGPAYAVAFLALRGVHWLQPNPQLVRFGATFPSLPPSLAALLAVLPATVGVLGLALVALVHLELARQKYRYLADWLPSLLLVYFSLLCALLTAFGRANFGVQEALASRYLTLSSLFWVGLLVPLSHLWRDFAAGRHTKKRRLRLFAATGATIFAALYLSTYAGGLVGLRQRNLGLRQAAVALRHLNASSDAELSVLYPDPRFVRQEAAVMQALRLGPYASLSGR